MSIRPRSLRGASIYRVQNSTKPFQLHHTIRQFVKSFLRATLNFESMTTMKSTSPNASAIPRQRQPLKSARTATSSGTNKKIGGFQTRYGRLDAKATASHRLLKDLKQILRLRIMGNALGSTSRSQQTRLKERRRSLTNLICANNPPSLQRLKNYPLRLCPSRLAILSTLNTMHAVLIQHSASLPYTTLPHKVAHRGDLN